MSKEEKDTTQENQESYREEHSNGHPEEHEEQENQQVQEEQDTDQEQKDLPSYKEYDKEELVELLHEKDQEIKELEEQLSATKDKHLRKVAEVDNIKKRIKKERSEIKEQAKINALEDFLPINDDLQRTLNAAEGLEIDDKFLDGVQMVADKFENILRQQGVERIDETMVPFDVDKHEAMMRQPADDEDVESNTVLQVLENGYRIGDRTIRHAKVIVSE